MFYHSSVLAGYQMEQIVGRAVSTIRAQGDTVPRAPGMGAPELKPI